MNSNVSTYSSTSNIRGFQYLRSMGNPSPMLVCRSAAGQNFVLQYIFIISDISNDAGEEVEI
jgi:hypothetical protein